MLRILHGLLIVWIDVLSIHEKRIDSVNWLLLLKRKKDEDDDDEDDDKDEVDDDGKGTENAASNCIKPFGRLDGEI